MLLLFILLATAILADSLKAVPLSGIGGMELLEGLTNNSENLTANETTANLSCNRTYVPLSGKNGTTLLKNLSISPANLSFGSTPRTPPPPPIIDYKAAELYTILRQNHIGY
jgi:hypothetical protein